MSRPPRLTFEGALYHITIRGNNRRPIFRRRRDRFRYLDFLGEAVKQMDWIVYAYCLMRNHIHLLLETPKSNISSGMHRLNGRYARYFNFTTKRTGHAFEDRFHGILIEKQPHLLEVARYVVLNPVRAGLCANAEEYEWSSYRATMGLAYAPPFLSADRVLELFGEKSDAARSAYSKYVADGHEARPWDALKEGRFLGSDDFVEEMKEWEGDVERSVENVSNF